MNLKDEKILYVEAKESITGVHKITGYNWQHMQGIITCGIVANDTHEIILNLFDRRKKCKRNF